MLVLLLLAGLGVALVLVGLFSYGSRHLRLVAEAEQYLAEREPAVTSELPVTEVVTEPVLNSESAKLSNQNLSASSTDSTDF